MDFTTPVSCRNYTSVFTSMKKSLLIILLLWGGRDLYSQNIKINWQNCHTYKWGEYQNTVSSVQVGNGLFILRNREENFPDGFNKIYLEKTDLNDHIILSRFFSSSVGAGGAKIVKADENNFYILGLTSHGGGDVTYNPYENTINIWVIKIDSSGNKLWDKVFGGTGGDYPQDIAVTTDGGVVVNTTFAAPYADSLYEGDASKYYGFWDMWVVKLNKDDGHIEWDYTYGSTMREYASSVIATSDGGCLAGGSSASSPDGNVSCYDESGQVITQGVLLKLNAQGEMEWQKCYGSSLDDGVSCLLETDDGYVVGGGTYGNDLDLGGGCPDNGNGWSNLWVFKIDKLGNLLWSKCYGGSLEEHAYELFQTSKGEIFVFGITESYNGDAIRTYDDVICMNRDIWMLKLSPQGELIWQRCIGNRGEQQIYEGVAMLDDHNFILAADSDFGSTGDLTCGTTIDSTSLDFSWIAHITDTTNGYGLGVHETLADRAIQIFPNPSRDYAAFKYTLPAGTTGALLQIKDLLGRAVLYEPLPGSEGRTLVNTSPWPPGTYIYSLLVGNKEYNGKIMVVH